MSTDVLEEVNEVKQSYNTEHEERVKAEDEIKEVCKAVSRMWVEFQGCGHTRTLVLFQLSSKLSSLIRQNSELVEQAEGDNKLDAAHAEIEALQKNLVLQQEQSESRVRCLEEEMRGLKDTQEENKSELKFNV